MKLFKYLLPVALAVGFTTTAAYANILEQDGSRYDVQLDERDFDALRDFVNTKRTIDVREKATNLTISGDVRAKWRHFTEKQHGEELRGGNAKECLGRCGTYHARGRNSDSSSDSSRDSSSDSLESVAVSSSSKNVIADIASSSESEDRPLDSILCLPTSKNDFNAVFNLRFDYVCDRAWAVAHLNYNNSMGVDTNAAGCLCDASGFYGSGEGDDLLLRKAYFGYNICCDGSSRFDVEVGRRGNLYNVFDSKIQFLSRFDGLLLKYNSTWECVADWYVNGAAFVVDERVNHFGWVAEVGFFNICDSGFDLKYSFIDWQKKGKNRCEVSNPAAFRFKNSQFTAAYHFDPEFLCAPAKLYGAFLWNAIGHTPKTVLDAVSSESKDSSSVAPSVVAASSDSTSGLIQVASESSGSRGRKHSSKQNLGGYVGFYVGEVVQEGDYAFDIRYEIVQPNAIPDADVSGIGRGNVLDEYYTVAGRGNTNYQGWLFEGLYALTDNLTLDTTLEFSRQVDKKIGGKHSYSKFEIEAIYAF